MTEHSRKPNRLTEYDYSQANAYFVTICTDKRKCILSDIDVGDGVLDVPSVRLKTAGKAAKDQIEEINRIYDHVAIEHYVIMPNHIHMLIIIKPGNGTSGTPSPTNSVLASLISTFKRFVHRRVGQGIFQRSYYDHVVRGYDDYIDIWQYIDNNPAKWAEDEHFVK